MRDVVVHKEMMEGKKLILIRLRQRYSRKLELFCVELITTSRVFFFVISIKYLIRNLIFDVYFLAVLKDELKNIN